MQRKTAAKKFIKELAKYTANTLRQKPIPEYSLGREKWRYFSDLYIPVRKSKVFIEVEEGQPHPDTNVTKYWFWLDQQKIKDRIFLIHVFGSQFYDDSYRSRTQLCDFVAKKISKSFNFKYIPIPKEKHHPYKASWRLHNLLALTKKEIREIIRKSNKGGRF